jgi:hypothetical protein
VIRIDVELGRCSPTYELTLLRPGSTSDVESDAHPPTSRRTPSRIVTTRSAWLM